MLDFGICSGFQMSEECCSQVHFHAGEVGAAFPRHDRRGSLDPQRVGESSHEDCGPIAEVFLECLSMSRERDSCVLLVRPALPCCRGLNRYQCCSKPRIQLQHQIPQIYLKRILVDSQVAGNNGPLYPKVDHFWA